MQRLTDILANERKEQLSIIERLQASRDKAYWDLQTAEEALANAQEELVEFDEIAKYLPDEMQAVRKKI